MAAWSICGAASMPRAKFLMCWFKAGGTSVPRLLPSDDGALSSTRLVVSSTSNVISPRQEGAEPFGSRQRRHGTKSSLRCEPTVQADFLRAQYSNVTKPSCRFAQTCGRRISGSLARISGQASEKERLDRLSLQHLIIAMPFATRFSNAYYFGIKLPWLALKKGRGC